MTGDSSDLSTDLKAKLYCLLSFYHHKSRIMGAPFPLANATKAEFDDYRTTEWDPDSTIVPWKKPLPMASRTTAEIEVEQWSKQIKPNKADYDDFKDEALWVQAKRSFLSTLESHNLQHLVDDTYTVTNKPLDDRQQKWLQKVFELKFQTPKCKSIITRYKDSIDTRAMWKEILDHHKKSVAANLRAQTISTYLTSTRLSTLNWKGTYTDFLHHFEKQTRILEEISPTGLIYTDAQKIQFLHTCVSGIPNLGQVLNMHHSACASTGTTSSWTFADYINGLLQAAASLDTGRATTQGRFSRSVNVHDLVFDDAPINTLSEEQLQFQTQVHNIDTPVSELLVNAMDQQPQRRRVMMDIATWKSLSKEDQTSWDRVSEDGKSKILGYAKNRESSLTTPTPSSAPNRVVNNHELIPSTPGEEKTENETVQATIHERTEPRETVPMPDTASHPANKKEGHIANIANVLSSTTNKGTSKYEDSSTEAQRSPYTVHAYSHELIYSSVDDDSVHGTVPSLHGGVDPEGERGVQQGLQGGGDDNQDDTPTEHQTPSEPEGYYEEYDIEQIKEFSHIFERGLTISPTPTQPVGSQQLELPGLEHRRLSDDESDNESNDEYYEEYDDKFLAEQGFGGWFDDDGEPKDSIKPSQQAVSTGVEESKEEDVPDIRMIASVFTGRPSDVNEIQQVEDSKPAAKPTVTRDVTQPDEALSDEQFGKVFTHYCSGEIVGDEYDAEHDPNKEVVTIIQPKPTPGSPIAPMTPLSQRVFPRPDGKGHFAVKISGEHYPTTSLNPTATEYHPSDTSQQSSLDSVNVSPDSSEGFRTVETRTQRKNRKKRDKKKMKAQTMTQTMIGQALKGVCEVVSPSSYTHQPSSSSASGSSEATSTVPDPGGIFSPFSTVSQHEPDEDYVPSPGMDFQKGKKD